MKEVRIVAFDVESCSVSGKYPTLSDLIIGISVHFASSIDPTSTHQSKLFVVDELTFEAEEKILAKFLNFLKENEGAILTAYNLVGFDQPIILTRSKEHYPLNFHFLDIIPSFSLYDTMIAYRIYAKSPTNCKLLNAIERLSANGYDYFALSSKANFSGRDVLSLWAKEKAGVSNDFSTYINEDSYNHLRLAQVLLSCKVKQGFWHSEA